MLYYYVAYIINTWRSRSTRGSSGASRTRPWTKPARRRRQKQGAAGLPRGKSEMHHQYTKPCSLVSSAAAPDSKSITMRGTPACSVVALFGVRYHHCQKVPGFCRALRSLMRRVCFAQGLNVLFIKTKRSSPSNENLAGTSPHWCPSTKKTGAVRIASLENSIFGQTGLTKTRSMQTNRRAGLD